MGDPDWSGEHVSRGNKFTLQVALAWLALLVTNAAFARTGALGFAFVGLATLFATWLLVHALFEHVDALVKTRIAEADGAGGEDGTAAASD
ncbi:hypothetical protein [Halobacterium yunchengense]|uniref:hypothetical protein n=1 Tax=Halobacterium yunchengense TaxID=3108497 RepID=UPI00300BCA70